MNRTLKRPMFRMGGAAEGITSGLDKPRQNYRDGSIKNQFEYNRLVENAEKLRPAAMDVFLQGARNRGQFTDDTPSGNMQSTANNAVGGIMSDAELIARARALAAENTPSNTMSGREMAARFLIPFGLDFATRSPTGNLLSTAAASAKGPVDMLIKNIDQRREGKTDREANLFSALLTSGLSDRRTDKKMAAQELKDSQELLTLYDNELQKNVIVKAGDVYNDLSRYGPSKKDETGKTFEKLEVANLIEEKMSEIFELEAKENKTAEDEQAIAQAKGVLEYLRGNKNTNAFANSILKDTEYLNTLRTKIKNKLKTTEKFQEKNPTTELLLQQAIDDALEYYIENGSFPPDLALAKGGRVELAQSFPGTAGDAMKAQDTALPPQMNEESKIDYETLRARLPREISDDIVKLIASSPEALEDFATIQTQQDVVNFNTKYNVELILPAEA